MHCRIFAIVSLAIVFAAGPAAGASQRDHDRCENMDLDNDVGPDRQIAACTRIIDSGRESDSARAEAYENRSDAWKEKGDVNRALADLSAAIELDPDNASHYYIIRGHTKRGQGDLDGALDDYSASIQANPDEDLAYVFRGNILLGKGDVDGALADYNESIRILPRSPMAHIYRGFARFLKGDFKGAADDSLSANNLTANANTMILRYLARGHLGQDGAIELAANARRLEKKDWLYAVIDFYLGRRSLDDLRASAGPDEKCDLAFYTGEWNLLRGNAAAARSLLQTAVEICPQKDGVYAAAELKRLASTAPAARERNSDVHPAPDGRTSAPAARAPPAPSASTPAPATVDQELAKCTRGRDLDLMIAACTHIVDDNSRAVRQRSLAYSSRGLAWRDKGDLDRAIADYNESIRVDPEYAFAYSARGAAWLAKHDINRAIADLNEAIRLNPIGAFAYSQRGLAWRVTGDHNRAIADYNEAIRLDPKFALPYYYRGLSWKHKGDKARAIADLSEALRLRPNDPTIVSELKRLQP